MREGTFALVPIEVIADRRLTLEQTRVLIALFSFRNKNTDTVWPSRSAISERTGIHTSNISAATTALVSLGWLMKDGVGGHSKATRYTITTPNLGTVAESATVLDATTVAESATVNKPTTVAESATVAERATVAESAMPTVAESATPPVAESATRKEQTSEQTNEQTNDAPTVPAVAAKQKSATKKTPDLTDAMKAACRATWSAYSDGYLVRYGVEPTFNSKVAKQVVDFVKRVGMSDAPQIARWFPSHPSAYYVSSGHVIGSLLKDAEKLRTEWVKGSFGTATAARQSDRRGAMGAAVQNILAEMGEGS